MPQIPIIYKFAFHVATLFIVTAMQLTSPLQAVGESKGKPNIIFIMSDDHAYQALSCYGSKINKTPNIDRIAKEGMLMKNCFVTNSICGPCRATILTGTYNHINGFIDNRQKFDGSQITFPKILQKSGYQTAVFGKWHLRTKPTGFDAWEVLIGQGPYYNPPMRSPKGVTKHTGYTTDVITDLTMNWLKTKRDKNKPFFLMYQHKAPHRNWKPGPKFLNKYDGKKIPEPSNLFDDYKNRGTAASSTTMTIERHLTRSDLKLTKPRGLNKEQLAAWKKAYQEKNKKFEAANLKGKDRTRWNYQRYIKDYLRCIASVDDNVGKLLDYLDKSGLAKNTIVVYTSDQGFYLGEHGWYDKRFMYEESFRTPFVIRWPEKIKAGTKADQLVMNLDIAETFLDIAGAEIPKRMQGKSMKPILLGQKTDDWRDGVYYHYYEFPRPHNVHPHLGIRTQRHKLIHFYTLDEWELFDLKEDPHEMKSVYNDPKNKELIADLKQRLKKLRKKYKDNKPLTPAVKAASVKLKLIKDIKSHEASAKKSKSLTIPTRKKNSPDSKPLTVGAWCHPKNGNGVIMAQGGEAYGWSLYLKDSAPTFAVRNGGKLTTIKGEKIKINQRSHIVAFLNQKGQGHLWVNGKPQGKPSPMMFITSQPADSISLGEDSGSLVSDYQSTMPFVGQLTDVRYYWGVMGNKALEKWAKDKNSPVNAQEKPEAKNFTLDIQIDKNGKCTINGKSLSSKEIRNYTEAKKTQPENVTVRISANENAETGSVQAAIQMCKEMKLSKFRLRSVR